MFARRVVVNIDRELILKTVDTRTGQIAAFDHKNSIIFAVYVLNVLDLVSTGKAAIRLRNLAVNYDFGFFSK